MIGRVYERTREPKNACDLAKILTGYYRRWTFDQLCQNGFAFCPCARYDSGECDVETAISALLRFRIDLRTTRNAWHLMRVV